MQAYSDKYNYIIKWNAKSGCTLFRRLFLHLHKNELNKKITNKWHQLSDDFPCINGMNKYTIHLVRNPYKRVVSMFTNKYCGGTCASVLARKINLDKNTFYNFVKYLHKSSNNNKWCDCHILPQSQSYDSKDIIIKLENFDNDIKKVYSTNNLQNLIPEIENFLQNMYNNNNNIDNPQNITKKNYDNYEFIGLKEFDINYCGAWSDYKYFYNDEIANLVYETYKTDFDLYGYSKNWKHM